jgi:hypothetical protein
MTPPAGRCWVWSGVAEGWTIEVVDVRVVYFDGCPSWRIAQERLVEALDRVGRGDAQVGLTVVESGAEAVAANFAGSLMILVDGRDLFPGPGVSESLSCRLYSTSGGLAGSPTVEELVTALRERRAG